jgi:putative PIN family toxin of toxin-antitoxin system
LQLSAEILDETTRILAGKFDWPDNDIAETRAVINSISDRVVPHVQLEVVKRDPDDNRVLECSHSSGSDYIVTGDKDLLDLKQHAGAKILRPTEFLAIIPKRLARQT